ncbi:MAG: hypothetical protein A3C06_01060 [Candidatus Taylorbacteria bacterium RIFCSPHIGHO2_02_FULL_46_13]|uniref:Cystathionine gamma-synthase n=1 Tax=Candidatus Taylorbacteria bacterium RIFCSPHIGHO2_02_FULL_46_13 TaxID=1802312 RepID=A0A1G2MVG8_9BACT|nr:MAG: hypothetical protein A3C06_01060 [Candidatus Taylorbacteria bacterium RIFCSPHIGHO2_02_FULL_46_13]
MSNHDKDFSFETLSVHAGEKPDPITGAVAPALIRTKTFKQPQFGKEGVWQYSRGKNPTRSILEEKLAALEGGGDATVFSSGVAAEAMFFLTLNPGDHVLFCHEVYGGTFRLMEQLFKRWGIAFDFIEFKSFEHVSKYIRPTTKYFFVETPTNPSLHIVDLALVKKISEKTRISFVVDGTFAPPCSTQAFTYGAETVIHSLSKYIAGHNDVIAGAVITKNKELHEKLKFMQKTVGAILSPDECYRVIQEAKTLTLRWKRVSKSAQKIALFLSRHAKIKRVLYPGLSSHPEHRVAKRQMKNGFGAVISFETKTSSLAKLKSCVEKVTENGLIVYGESLASPETILAYPPLMSHKSLSKKDRLSLGISDSFFRFSVGFEDPDDLIRELERGLRRL